MLRRKSDAVEEVEWMVGWWAARVFWKQGFIQVITHEYSRMCTPGRVNSFKYIQPMY